MRKLINIWEGLSVKRLISFCLSMTLAVALGAQRADAGYLLPFSGNTFPSSLAGGGVDAHVNFAVLDHTGGTLGDSFNTGLAGFDAHFVAGVGSGALSTGSKYLYLFQTVNDGVNTAGITTNSVSVDTAFVTSHGVFAGTGFTQVVLGVPTKTAAGGPYIGVGAAAGNTSPASVVGSAPGMALNGAVVGPSFTTFGSSSVVAFFFPPLGAGATSAVWGYTSDMAPTFQTTGILDHGTTANGTVPSATPEPASLVLGVFGVLGLVGYGRRKRASV